MTIFNVAWHYRMYGHFLNLLPLKEIENVINDHKCTNVLKTSQMQYRLTINVIQYSENHKCIHVNHKNSNSTQNENVHRPVAVQTS